MNKTALAVLALVWAAPAGAQEYRQQQAQAAEEAYQGMQAAAAQTRGADYSKGRSWTLEAALMAMNDGPEAGGRVSRLLEERKITVYFATQAEPVKRGVVNGGDAILLSDALPAHPRVYAPLIAYEAAKALYADMPASGERSYMVMATAARVFAELGGDIKSLPAIDGDDVVAVQKLISPWKGNIEATVDALARRDNVPTLPELQSTDAESRFSAFLLDERDARREALSR